MLHKYRAHNSNLIDQPLAVGVLIQELGKIVWLRCNHCEIGVFCVPVKIHGVWHIPSSLCCWCVAKGWVSPSSCIFVRTIPIPPRLAFFPRPFSEFGLVWLLSPHPHFDHLLV